MNAKRVKQLLPLLFLWAMMLPIAAMKDQTYYLTYPAIEKQNQTTPRVSFIAKTGLCGLTRGKRKS